MTTKPSKLIEPYRIERGSKFRLKDIDPGDTGPLKSEFKKESAELLEKEKLKLAELQEKLYAQDRWAVLLIFQAMDAAGKDSAIKHVMSGVNPQGCQVYSFKAPSAEELDHDFMWRAICDLPERGRIGIFNRSYYEDALVVRVHKEILAQQRIPKELVTKRVWKDRFEDICAIERYLSRNGVLIRKFFLHVSKEEQRQRFIKRLEEPEKNWKFSVADVKERDHWDEYMGAYEDVIRHTSTKHAPWFVVPADKKWYTRLVVSAAVIDALEELELSYPKVDASRREQLAQTKASLLKEE